MMDSQKNQKITFKSRIGNVFASLASSKKRLFFLGLFLILLPTVVKIIGDRHSVFMVYKYGCIDFWNNINPYSDWNHNVDKYLYGPVFSIFFSVFAFFPSWLGGFLWNVFNYCMLFLAIFSLPENVINYKNKRFVFLFLLPIICTELFFFQANIFVTYLFLFAFGLFEKGKYLQAILLILFSGFSKIYGLVQIAFIIYYKSFWRNFVFALILIALFYFIPLLKIPFDGLNDYYISWFEALSRRHDSTKYETIYNLLYFLGFKSINNYTRIFQLTSFVIMTGLTIMCWKRFKLTGFRLEILGLLMGWLIIFSNASESHTYIIALTGYLLWYTAQLETRVDRILLWSNFFILTIIPIDVLCPAQVRELVFDTLHLNLFLFLFTWLRMVYITYGKHLLKPLPLAA